MCRPNSNCTASLPRRPSRLLLTHSSFVHDDKHAHALSTANPYLHGLGGPSLLSTLLTVAFYVAVLFLWEFAAYLFITQYVHINPILESQVNRQILARHIACDFSSLVYCAYLAISQRHICHDLLMASPLYKRSDSMRTEDYEKRVFRYHPGCQRLMVIFFVYQVKNMYDSIYWNDGIEFVLHHIFAGMAAWGGMYPGCLHFYALFYFGFSEISTAILSLLANFDPIHGVEGLDEVFPITKIVLGGLFVVSFIICRVIAWPYVTYYFTQDALKAMKCTSKMAEGRRGYVKAIFYCCAALSAIQILFVYMIIVMGKQEIKKMLG
ncbi:hypothetical protein ACHAXN_003189 [Cyclotella atomus]